MVYRAKYSHSVILSEMTISLPNLTNLVHFCFRKTAVRALYLCVGFGLIFGSVKLSSPLTGKLTIKRSGKLLLLYIVLVADINKITTKTVMSNEEQHKKEQG